MVEGASCCSLGASFVSDVQQNRVRTGDVRRLQMLKKVKNALRQTKNSRDLDEHQHGQESSLSGRYLDLLHHLSSHTPPSGDVLEQAKEYIYSDHSRLRSGRLGAVLDLGCGSGKLLPWLSHSFDTVYARDPNEDAIRSARLLTEDTTKAAQVRLLSGLPSLRSGTQFDIQVGSDSELKLGQASVDCVIALSAAHLFDWTSPWALYNRLERILKPGGSFIVLGNKPVFKVQRDADSTAPSALLRLTTTLPPEAEPYADSGTQLGFINLYSSLPLPWDVEAEGWDETSHVYQQRDEQTLTPSGEERTMTPKGVADWLRNTPLFQRYAAAHPRQRTLASLDADVAAEWVRSACQADGVEYDSTKLAVRTLSVLWAIRRK